MTTAGTPKYDALENRNIPNKWEKLTFLYYGTKEELTEQKIKPVVICKIGEQ